MKLISFVLLSRRSATNTLSALCLEANRKAWATSWSFLFPVHQWEKTELLTQAKHQQLILNLLCLVQVPKLYGRVTFKSKAAIYEVRGDFILFKAGPLNPNRAFENELQSHTTAKYLAFGFLHTTDAAGIEAGCGRNLCSSSGRHKAPNQSRDLFRSQPDTCRNAEAGLALQ